MQLSCSLYNPLLWPQGVGSPGGGLMGLIFIPEFLLFFPGTVSAHDVPEPTELVAAHKDVMKLSFGSWLPTFFFLFKIPSARFSKDYKAKFSGQFRLERQVWWSLQKGSEEVL